VSNGYFSISDALARSAVLPNGSYYSKNDSYTDGLKPTNVLI
jgi:hypothetical protein